MKIEHVNLKLRTEKFRNKLETKEVSGDLFISAPRFTQQIQLTSNKC